MNRREFVRSTSLAFAGVALSKAELSFSQQTLPPSDGWRTFEVTTHAEVLEPAGETESMVTGGAHTEHAVSADDVQPV